MDNNIAYHMISSDSKMQGKLTYNPKIYKTKKAIDRCKSLKPWS